MSGLYIYTNKIDTRRKDSHSIPQLLIKVITRDYECGFKGTKLKKAKPVEKGTEYSNIATKY